MSILTTTHKTFIEIEFIEDICIKNATGTYEIKAISL